MLIWYSGILICSIFRWCAESPRAMASGDETSGHFAWQEEHVQLVVDGCTGRGHVFSSATSECAALPPQQGGGSWILSFHEGMGVVSYEVDGDDSAEPLFHDWAQNLLEYRAYKSGGAGFGRRAFRRAHSRRRLPADARPCPSRHRIKGHATDLLLGLVCLPPCQSWLPTLVVSPGSVQALLLEAASPGIDQRCALRSDANMDQVGGAFAARRRVSAVGVIRRQARPEGKRRSADRQLVCVSLDILS